MGNENYFGIMKSCIIDNLKSEKRIDNELYIENEKSYMIENG